MDGLEDSWESLVERASRREPEPAPELASALRSAGLADEPGFLRERVGELLGPGFWEQVHDEPSAARGRARLTQVAAELIGEPPSVQAELGRREGIACFALGWTAAAHDVLEAALARVGPASSETPPRTLGVRGAILAFLGNARLARGRVRAALVALEEALALARRTGNPAALGSYLAILGNARLQAGDALAAGGYYREALELARAQGNVEGQAVVLGNLGLVAHAHARLDQAEAHYEAALALARQLGDRRTVALVETNLGLLAAQRGELEEAVRRYDAAAELARRVEDGATEALALLRSAEVARERAAFAEAGRLLARAGKLLQDADDPRLGSVWDEEGRVALAQGDAATARASFARVLEVACRAGDPRAEAAARYDLGRAELADARPTAALVQLDAALALERELADPLAEAAVQLARCEALAAADRLAEAADALGRAGEQVAALPASPLAARALLARATLLRPQEPTAARELLRQARRLARRRGFAALAARAEACLAELEGGPS